MKKMMILGCLILISFVACKKVQQQTTTKLSLNQVSAASKYGDHKAEATLNLGTGEWKYSCPDAGDNCFNKKKSSLSSAALSELAVFDEYFDGESNPNDYFDTHDWTILFSNNMDAATVTSIQNDEYQWVKGDGYYNDHHYILLAANSDPEDFQEAEIITDLYINEE